MADTITPPTLPPNASMIQMIEALWRLPRDLVSEGYDAALHALAGQLPMTIHEYPTGTPCFTWTVPEKWHCREARLETLDGRVLLTSRDNPLHVASYSTPFCGEITREELLPRLHVHPRLPDAVPFRFFYYTRDWGLCCTQALKDSLTEARYRVVIDAAFSPGTLKVGEAVLPGQSDDCFVFCAHLCHPAMVNDDLSGVVVGIDVMRRLARLPRRRYTYRLVILPETIGSAAYLSHNEALIPTMRGDCSWRCSARGTATSCRSPPPATRSWTDAPPGPCATTAGSTPSGISSRSFSTTSACSTLPGYACPWRP